MPDKLSPAQRSAHMSKIRSKGNRSTELRVAGKFASEGIRGWIKHPSNILGKPDFLFPKLGLVLFVDGCFWHGCAKCNRNTPSTRTEFWSSKIEGNRRRDRRNTRRLRREGYHVIRIWEHDLGTDGWFRRLKRMIERIESEASKMDYVG